MGYNNTFLILDCGIKKHTKHIMTKLGRELYDKYKIEQAKADYTMSKYMHVKEQYDQWRRKVDEWNVQKSKYAMDFSEKEDPDGIYRNIDPRLLPCGGCPEAPQPSYNIDKEELEKARNFKPLLVNYSPKLDSYLCRYYNIRPFEPWVMINISPDWKGKEITTSMVEDLSKLVRSYMKENWYSEWHYSIESGGEGNHLHTHIVAKLNQDRLQSTKTHLKKGNHTQQLKKYGKKIKGLQGLIKGPGIQKIFINNEEILADKLDYLIESKKPDGHKNMEIEVGCNFKVKGCL
jgi:hypothetical protein